MKGALQWLASVALAVILIAILDRVPALKRADTFTEQHRSPLVAARLTITILGFVVLTGGGI